MKSQQKKLTIIGLGLVGGSLGAALRKAGGWFVTGYDLNSSVCQAAVNEGYVDECFQDIDIALRGADVIALATPIRSILDYLEELKDRAPDGSMVIDLGSTKRVVCAAMDQLPERISAIGGHPMAGKKTSGVAGASENLYKGRKFILVKNQRTTEKAMRLATQIIDDIEGVAVIMDADLHDRLVAMISHLPHFLSIPLLQSTEEIGDERAWDLAAGGYRNVAERAIDNPRMWEEIVFSNADNIADSLRKMAGNLNKFADTLESGNEAEMKFALQSSINLYEKELN